MPKTKYLMYVDCSNTSIHTETHRVFEVEHPDNGLDGIEEAQEYVGNLAREIFGRIIKAIKPEYLEFCWTRDIFVRELSGIIIDSSRETEEDEPEHAICVLFDIAILAITHRAWLLDWTKNQFYSKECQELAKVRIE